MAKMTNKEKLKQRLEQATVRDHTNMRHWRARRERRIDRIMNEPVLPLFCTICFICMVVAASSMAIVDVTAHLTYLSHLGTLHMLNNAVTSAFFGWLAFAIIVIPCSAVQIKRGFDDPYFERFRMTKRGKPRMPIAKRFRLYLHISAIGTAVLFVLYLLVRIFA